MQILSEKWKHLKAENYVSTSKKAKEFVVHKNYICHVGLFN